MKQAPLSALAQALHLNHKSQCLIKGVAIDSRKVKAGDLFFALSGKRVDGHQFLKEAAQKGAVSAVVQKNYSGNTFGLQLLHVSDVLLALQELARQSVKSKIIGITGSLGKTTVKEFTLQLLQDSYVTYASPLSYNSQATLPLSILMAEGNEDYLILEMGMSQKGELANLVSIAPPDIALLTTISFQHAVNFTDGIKGIRREKSKIFSHAKTKLGIIPHDLLSFKEVYQTGACHKMTFSTTSKAADYYLEKIEKAVKIFVKGKEECKIAIQLPNEAHYHNFLAAIVLARAVCIPWEAICKRAAFFRLPLGRFEKVVKNGIIFINDAFNADPVSMTAALKNLPKPNKGGQTIAVLTEMNALGKYSDKGHASVAKAALKAADLLLCLGSRSKIMVEIWEKEGKTAYLYQSRQQLEAALRKYASSGDVVLLKGARCYALDEILSKF